MAATRSTAGGSAARAGVATATTRAARARRIRGDPLGLARGALAVAEAERGGRGLELDLGERGADVGGADRLQQPAVVVDEIDRANPVEGEAELVDPVDRRVLGEGHRHDAVGIDAD